ncbi:MAG: type IX secretion system outer membrane channel protein PorV [Chitinophagaceae bacterium]|nr:type IX secretion system outer membrane channel protein PorV [Chitinophagaceae bacterium]MCB9054517.1 type IX secretion system outer membrane channel protein PorV [Chitinophagales bacterium]
MRPTALKLTAGLLIFCGLSTTNVKAQADPINVVTTAVPFLRISPDARSGGMGELGVATSPDQYSGLWNIGKVAFNQSQGGVGATYTPWLKDIVNDVYLATLSGFYKFSDDKALSASVRYFSLGDITFTDNQGNDFGSFRPREFGIDVGYSMKLGEKNGIGVALKYINSNLAGGQSVGGTTYKTGSAVAGDIGYYHNGVKPSGDGWNWGVVLSNLGSKISYTENSDSKDYIPANIGVGVVYNKVLNEKNKLSIGAEINKLLVPTPPSDPATADQIMAYRSKGVVSSWFSSLGDAPGGFGEEMKEIQYSAGAEYWYNNQFALRAGYLFEHKTKGDRNYFTTGLGLKYNVFGFNFAYLIPTGNGVNRNPLSNTLRFSVLFDFNNDGGDKK